MAYCTVADIRDEGITDAQVSDVRLSLLIDEATQTIDRITGWFFEPRQMTLRLDGRGAPTIEPPYPPISISEFLVNDWDFAITDANMVTVGAPVQPGFVAPRFTLVDGRVFPNRRDIIEVRGLWGYTEDDGTAYGRTPLEIRRACMLLVIRQLPPLGDTDAVADARSQWRIIEEKTRDQSYKLDKPAGPAPITGDPEIDSILIRYRRPPGLAAA